MAITGAQQDVVSRLGQVCQALLELDGKIEQIDTLWNGTPNYVAQVTDAELLEVASFAGAGVTLAVIADALYCVKQARVAWRANLPPVTVMGRMG